MSNRNQMRCSKCGRPVGIYLDEVSGRYIAHKFPFAFHRAAVERLTIGKAWYE